MQIPNDPVVWIVLIVCVAIAVGFAVWRRYNIVVRRGDTELRVERAEDKAPTPVSVAANLVAEDAEFGKITGVKGEAPGGAPVSVLGSAKLSKTKMGDITGIETGPPKTGNAG